MRDRLRVVERDHAVLARAFTDHAKTCTELGKRNEKSIEEVKESIRRLYGKIDRIKEASRRQMVWIIATMLAALSALGAFIKLTL